MKYRARIYMKFINKIIFLISLTVLLGSCAANSQSRDIWRRDIRPEWYGYLGSNDIKYFYGIGESLDRTMAENQALANAMRELSMYVESHVTSSVKLLSIFREESGIDSYYFDEFVSKINISTTNSIRNSRVSKTETFRDNEGFYVTYIQVAFEGRLFQEMINENNPSQPNRTGVLNTPN